MAHELAVAVLAAGEGRRMGGPKALVRTPQGLTFLEVVIQGALSAEPLEVVVVLEPCVAERFSDERVECVCNPYPERGMALSLLYALLALRENAQGVLVALVDHPLVRPSTYSRLAAAWRTQPNCIVLPTVAQRKARRRGHPVIFPRALFSEFSTQEAMERGPRHVINKFHHLVVEVAVQDEGILIDVDTPRDYTAAFGVPPPPVA